MFLKRAPWALPILLALAGCGGGSSLTTPRAPDAAAVATGHIAYVQEGQFVPTGVGPEGVVEGRTASDIFIRRADGSDFKQLSAGTNQPFNSDPAISPDGRRVAFRASGVGRVRDAIYIVNADGTDLRRVFEIAGFIQSLKWTPDGASLIYVLADISANDGVGKNLIYRLRADGDAAPQLVFNDGKSRVSPAIAPDGRTLAYLLTELENGAGEIFTARLDSAGRATGTPRQLTSDNSFSKFDLVFAPNGQRLVYAATPRNSIPNLQFKSIHLDGTLAPNLPAATDNARGLSFSPDGQFLAFTSTNYNGGINPGRGASRILVARADGSGQPRVLTGNLEGGGQFSPSWGR